MEVSAVYSVAGMLGKGEPLVLRRPFLAPHHSITKAALVGGGMIPMPGQISLAHRGVLFMDELPEFGRDQLDLLRQPLEDHEVTIVRQSGSYRYPARFILLGACNPCPCGHYPDRNRWAGSRGRCWTEWTCSSRCPGPGSMTCKRGTRGRNPAVLCGKG